MSMQQVHHCEETEIITKLSKQNQVKTKSNTTS